MARALPTTLETSRLCLRPFRDEDRAPFAQMNADPLVMRFMPTTLTSDASDALAERIRAHHDTDGFGLWAVEERERPGFLGFIGLSRPTFDAPFTPCVEIGWRLAARVWGRGYATEGARAALAFGFEQAGLDEIVSFTIEANAPSWRVMRRLGMQRAEGEDFDHPRVPEGHPFRRHLLYRLTRDAWRLAATNAEVDRYDLG